LRRATFAQRVILILMVANSFRRPHFSSVQIFLMMFLFKLATFARRDTFLQAAVNFLLDSQCPRLLSFIFWWRFAARLQTLRRFLGPPTGITAASFLGFFWCSYMEYIIHGSG
jgi:hypothetical protein